jgi:hypothetical protein
LHELLKSTKDILKHDAMARLRFITYLNDFGDINKHIQKERMMRKDQFLDTDLIVS